MTMKGGGRILEEYLFFLYVNKQGAALPIDL